jgi:hypothetical protein
MWNMHKTLQAQTWFHGSEDSHCSLLGYTMEILWHNQKTKIRAEITSYHVWISNNCFTE